MDAFDTTESVFSEPSGSLPISEDMDYIFYIISIIDYTGNSTN